MSFLSDAMSFGVEDAENAAGEVVTYDYAGSSVSLQAIIGQSQFEEGASDGEGRIQTKTVDFLVRVDRLKLSGVPVEPRAGATIKTADDDVYEVIPGGVGVSWSWSEGRKTRYRIHTVRRVKG